MKTQIRRNVFETNSSSVHTITIRNTHSKSYNIPSVLEFTGGEFGWEVEDYADASSKASYLYIALYNMYPDKIDKYKEHIENVLAKYNCEAEFETPDESLWSWGIINHCNLQELVEVVMNDEAMLIEYLFGDAMIYTFNDNMDYDNLPFLEEMEEKCKSPEYVSIVKGN